MSNGSKPGSNTDRLGINRRGVLKSGIATALTGFAGVGSVNALDQTQESAGSEYFVAKDGDDSNDGLSRESPFQTIQQGVDHLDPGDTLTISPGEYFESVEREDLGANHANTTIRAEVPGTAVLRGDVPAPEFEKVDEYRHVYAADFSQEVQAVNEVDSLEVLETVPNIPELDFDAGNFYYDDDADRLYISTSDMRSADEHDYTVSILGSRAGLFLHHPTRVVVDGLATTGFHSNTPFDRLPGGDGDSDRSPWGIFLPGAKDCVIRNVTSYLNTGGIGIRSDGDLEEAGGNRIENCIAYGNRPRDGIDIYRPNDDVIRDSVAFRNGVYGIRFYLGVDGEQPRMEDNLAWDNGEWDFQLKAGSGINVAERCVGPGDWHESSRSDPVRNSLIGHIRDEPDHFQDNIYFHREDDLDLDAEFADPVNHDYRLQPTSRFRGRADDGGDLGPFPYEENIYYVSPDGDDSDDGLSPETAWQSPARAADALAPGDTLYLESGTYQDGLQVATGSQDGDEPISVRSRGTGQVVIQDTVEVAQGNSVEFERVNFAGDVTVDQSQGVRFHNCRFLGSDAGLHADSVAGVRLTQSEFTGFDTAAVVLRNSSDVYLAGNIFDNAGGAAVDTDTPEAIHYSDYNSYRSEATAWRIGDTTTALSDLDAETERYATVGTPEFQVDNGTVELANRLTFATGGPKGNSLGVHLRQSLGDDGRELLVDGPVVHSTTATTANVEWWSSEPAVFRVHWGDTPAMEHSETLTAETAYHPTDQLETFNTFSLDDLEPDTEYHFEVEFVEFADGDQNATIEAGTLKRTVTTAADDPEPRTLYVSPAGDDSQSGLSESDAWETIHHAANQVRPGDTVVLGEGTYSEKVRIRATGTEDARITFKAAADEKVVLDGAEESLASAFAVYNYKNSLAFDGLYTRQYFRDRGHEGTFSLLRSDDIRITRCFHDGRDVEGYSPALVTSSVVDDLLVKNCVSVSTWDGLAISSSTNVRVKNNVIVLPFIRAMGVEGCDREDILVRDNIFTDNLPNKNGQELVLAYLYDEEDSNFPIFENNCFYLRQPEEERDENVLGTGGWFEPHMSIEEYNDEWEVDNFEADPKFLMDRNDGDGNTRTYFNSGVAHDITGFGDLLTSNSELNKRDVGLIRGDLSDRIDLDEE